MPPRLRLAELIAALSLATDLGMGQPLEQALRTCLVALALGERLGLNGPQLSEVYYVALLRFVGCTADAHEAAQMAGGDDIALRAAIAPVLGGSPPEFMRSVLPVVGEGKPPLRRARLVAGLVTGQQRARAGVRSHCEVAENLSSRLGFDEGVRQGLAAAFEQWNGGGMPGGLRGDRIPVSARIVFLARDVEVWHRLGGAEAAVRVARARAGSGYDPHVVQAFLDSKPDLLLSGVAGVSSPWDEVLAREPEPAPWLPESKVDAALTAFADFIDLKCPHTAGHSRGVAELAAAAATTSAVAARRAGLLHDLGRATVPNGVWDKPGPLTDGEWERVRLHPYYSERIVGRLSTLQPLAAVVGMHHERLDGSGYHRGSVRSALPPQARLLAAADVYQAMTQPRPHRPAHTPDAAAEMTRSLARSGTLDADAVDAVLSAAGHRLGRVRTELPAGLSEREVEVLRALARGATKKQVAQRMSISPRTVDHHVRHIYSKAGVTSRAGAALFAIEHDLLE